jgi:hypothetical protein
MGNSLNCLASQVKNAVRLISIRGIGRTGIIFFSTYTTPQNLNQIITQASIVIKKSILQSDKDVNAG